MHIKFNWGYGIALFYTTFVVVLLYFVVQSTKQDNSLVSDQYYADDIHYQQHYDKLRNAQALAKDLDISKPAEQDAIYLQFPEDLGPVSGKVRFFCPSDSRADFSTPVKTDARFSQSVSSKNLKRGLWRVKVDWEAGGKAYYREEAITL
ncbi:MAG: FixH family protein [Haliscomenobacter sp.]